MARKAGLEFAGAVYHLLDRGDRQESIFWDDRDRARFLETLGEVCQRTGAGETVEEKELWKATCGPIATFTD